MDTCNFSVISRLRTIFAQVIDSKQQREKFLCVVVDYTTTD